MPNPFRKKSNRAKAEANVTALPKRPAAKKTRGAAVKRSKPKKGPKSLEKVVAGALDDLKADDVHVLDPTREPTLTLVTCYPFYFLGNAPQRFIVQARLMDNDTRRTAGQPASIPPSSPTTKDAI